jgi:hypothetical protein
MGLSSIITAALPIPIALAKFIPIYSFQTKCFSVFTPLFCSLLLAYIFYRRHALAPLMFPHLRQDTENQKPQGSATVSTLPAFFILGCIVSVIGYVSTLTLSVNSISMDPFNEVLQQADQR